MDTIVAIHTRRSIRSYEPRAVPRALVEAIVWDAAQAPVTPVSEPWVFHVVEGVERIAALGERAKAYARANRPAEPGFAWAERPEFRVFLGAPVVIAISAPAANPQSSGDCTRAGQNLMLSAHARGLGTCWVGAPLLWLGDPAVKRELGIADPCAAFAVFTLGYPRAPAPARVPDRPWICWVD
jgi:nitroreductase